MTPQEGLAAIKTLCDDTILHDHDGFGVVYVSRIRDVLADVDPEPAPASSTIDHNALNLALHLLAYGNSDEQETRDRILAFVQPGQGITLTAEEARTAAAWYTGDLRDDGVNELALAERLERLGGDA